MVAVGDPNFNNSIFNTLFKDVTAHGELKKTYIRFDQNALISAKITPIVSAVRFKIWPRTKNEISCSLFISRASFQPSVEIEFQI